MRIENMTTLLYLKRISCGGRDVLFIVKKSNGLNNGKYLGIGGHFEDGESPYDCMIRELKEETGITIDKVDGLKQRGIVTFVNDMCDNEYMHVFEGTYQGIEDISSYKCDEGELKWIPLENIYDLPIWEGDKVIFKKLFESSSFFNLKLIYHGDELTNTIEY